jgi:hypothetical protein
MRVLMNKLSELSLEDLTMLEDRLVAMEPRIIPGCADVVQRSRRI